MKLRISRFFLFAVLAVLTAGMAKAGDTFTLPGDIVIPLGTEVYTLEIGLDNEKEYTEGQFDLVLPQELTLIQYKEDQDGYEQKSYFKRTSRVIPTTTVAESNPADGVYRLVFFNAMAQNIQGNEGTVFTCQIDTRGLEAGAYPIELNKMELSSSVNGTVEPEAISTTLYIIQIAIEPAETTISLGGETKTLEVTVTPEDAPFDLSQITWSSDDPETVSVEDGVIKGLALGTATITAECQDLTATCEVTVKAVLPEQINLAETQSILLGESAALKAEVLPANTTDKTLSWDSSDETIVSVDEEGNITGVKLGTATITVTANADETVKAQCVVTVNPVLATAIALPSKELDVLIGSTTPALEVSFTPENTTDKTITWSSSDETILKVAEDGTLTAVALGSATLTAVTTNGVEAMCEVTVNPVMATAIVLSKEKLEVLIGSTTPALEVTFTPENTTDKTIIWSSSDEAILKVAEDGTLTAVALGTATLTATTTNDVEAKCEVTVNPILAESITLSMESLSLLDGDTVEALEVIFDPEDTTIKTVEWSSSDETVVKVAQDGTIKAVGIGKADVIATTTNGKTAKCEVTVSPVEVETVTLSQTEATILVDETLTLTAEITPENATYKTLTWTSSDEAVATVKEGVVTGTGVGTATITATAHNGKNAQCEVTVKPVLAQTITLSATEITLAMGTTNDALEVTFTPANTTDKTIVWTSSDEAILTVAEDGTITTLEEGTAVITATTTNGIEAKCEVTVIPTAASAIELSASALSVFIGDELPALEVTFTPVNAIDKTIKWSTSDPEVVTIATDGKMKAVGLGTATITATAVTGVTAECVITVRPYLAQTITLSQDKLTMTIGDTHEALEVTFNPEFTTDKTVTWSSSDEAIVKVAEDGTIIAVGVGVATVTATTVNEITASCEVTVLPIEAQTLTLSQTEATLLISQTLTLKATFTPEDSTDKTLTWSSSDEAVATVKDGVVTAIAVGEATITATATNGVKAECKVRVNPIEADGIALSKTQTSLVIGSTETLTVEFDPADTTDKTIVWTSSEETVATVKEGVVTAVAVGKATITATAANGKTATCEVTVLPIEVATITLSQSEATIVVNETLTLTAVVAPEDATVKTITWTSSDEAVATVNEGVVSALSVGKATITATASNGVKAECVVTVKPIETESIILSKAETTLVIGSTETLTVTFVPEDATDKTITWSSENEEVATVENGTITAIAVGKATIKATAANGKIATCQVTVLPIQVETIVLSESEITLEVGQTEVITATVTPANATYQQITWSSSDDNIATISKDGSIFAVAAGTAVITATAENGITADCVVTVLKPAPIELVISETELTLTVGESTELTATLLPEGTEGAPLVWTSEDESVVTVIDGLVTAVGAGSTNIIVTSGMLSATCHIIVENATSSIDNALANTGKINVFDRTIVVDTKAMITVCNSAGVVLYRGYNNTVEVGAAGLYLIQVGNKTSKVIIR